MGEAKLGPAPPAPLERVEWRVDSKPFDRNGKTVCRYVPYLDAATIAGLLDQWVGPGCWSDEYHEGTIGGSFVLWCHLSILVDGAWVTKRDVGKPSSMESEKGAVSDAFKRAACLKWGVGRNVYDLTTLWAVCRTDNQGKAWPTAGTGADLIGQLKKLGFDASGAKVLGAEPGGDQQAQAAPAEQAQSAPSEQAEQAEPAKPAAKPAAKAAAGNGPMDRINNLGLDGKGMVELKESLISHGVPWPPVNLDEDQAAALEGLLLARESSS